MTTPPPISYFAYGSNMLRERLLDRHVLLLDNGQAAQVIDYDLVFNKKSDDHSSKANLMPATGTTSWGVLFSVNSTSLEGLDAAEGAPAHYCRASVIVRTPDAEFQAMTYLAQPDKLLSAPDQPWDWYLALMIAGAKACQNIPIEWIQRIQTIGSPKQSSGSFKSSLHAIAQLKAAGYDNWPQLLEKTNETTL